MVIVHYQTSFPLQLCSLLLLLSNDDKTIFCLMYWVSIHERSKEVDGKRFGDFEMDLIVDPNRNAILTPVEKSTNMLLMQKLPFGKQSKPPAKVVRKLLLPYKDYLKTITTDNGPEFAAHKDITKYLGVPVYFADPYCSWQKGTIENTNKLIRQYIPKKDSFNQYTDKRIMSIQKKLNERPREKLNPNRSLGFLCVVWHREIL